MPRVLAKQPRIHDPWDFVAGRTWKMTDVCVDDDGVPLPIEGATWRLDSVDGGTNFLSQTLGNGVSFLDTNCGEIIAEPQAAATASVPAGTYRDWLTVTLTTGEIFDLWTGIIRAAAAPA